MDRRQSARWLIVGISVTTASFAVHQLVYRTTDSAVAATLVRLGVALPLLYLGYSRYVLGGLLRDERVALGRLRSEARMLGRVGLAVGISFGAKAAFEPWLTELLVARFGTAAAGAAVLLGDYVYGPLSNYAVLALLGGKKRQPARSPREASLSSSSSLSSTWQLAPEVSVLSTIRLALPQRILLAVWFGLARLFGSWRRPRATEGDVATMTFRDKVHWLFKTRHPVVCPPRGTTEEWHREHRTASPPLPPGFVKDGELTLSAVGDLLPTVAAHHPESDVYGGVADLLFGADLAFGNLEAPVREGPDVEIVLSGKGDAPEPSMSPALFARVAGHAERRFDLLATANNHSLDFGRAGLASTHAALDRHAIPAVGTGMSAAAAATPRILERRGVRVGFVAATFGSNGKPLPDGEALVNVVPFNRANVDPELSLEELLAPLTHQLDACRRAGCAIVVASLHWGLESELFPSSSAERVAQHLVDRGADVILGHHPHVIQPVQVVPSLVDPARAGLVFYSLGNFLAPFHFLPWSLGLLGRVRFALGERAGRRVAHLESFDAIPLLQLLLQTTSGDRTVRIVPLAALLSGQPSERVASFAESARVYADLVLGEEWRERARDPAL